MSISFTDKCLFSLPFLGPVFATIEECEIKASIRKIAGVAWFNWTIRIDLMRANGPTQVEVCKLLCEKNEAKKYKLVGLLTTMTITLVALLTLKLTIPFIITCALFGPMIGITATRLSENRITIRDLERIATPGYEHEFPIREGSFAYIG